MVESVSASELREVVTYIQKMKEYDRNHFIKLQQINDLVWGIFFLMAGILDYLFSITDKPGYSAVPWAFMSFGGMSVSLYINTRKPKEILTEEIQANADYMKRMYRYVIAMTIIAWSVMMFLVTRFELYDFILPVVSFLIGSTILGFNYQELPKFYVNRVLNPRYRLFFIPLTCYLATVVNLLLYLIAPDLVDWMGPIMGMIVGFGFASGAFIETD